jgi:sugar lactone lactonase YvrE
MRHSLEQTLGVCLFALMGAAACGSDSTNDNPRAGDGGGSHADAAPLPGNDAGLNDSSSDSPSASVGLTLTKVANDPGVSSPFDATPDVDGMNVYFTAVGSKGPGVFKVAATGGAITEVFSGPPFISPFAICISADGTQLYVADAAAETTSGDAGAIFAMPVGGATPAIVGGTDGLRPRGLEFSGDQLYFTGSDSSGGVGVFKMAAAGGPVSPVAVGAPFHDPSGLTISTSGDVYVVDTGSTTTTARVIRVANGTPSVFVDGISVGYPSGIVLSLDESQLLLSALDPDTGTDTILIVDRASKTVISDNMGIATFTEAAGLHRAKTKNVFAWADSVANQTGTVYVVSP